MGKYKYTYKKEIELPVYKIVYNGETFVLKLDQFLKDHNISQREIENYFSDNELGQVHRSFLYRLTSGKDLNSLGLTPLLLTMGYLREKTGKDIQLNDIIEIVPVQPVEE